MRRGGAVVEGREGEEEDKGSIMLHLRVCAARGLVEGGTVEYGRARGQITCSARQVKRPIDRVDMVCLRERDREGRDEREIFTNSNQNWLMLPLPPPFPYSSSPVSRWQGRVYTV
jgi:hypothetical protein